MMPSGRLWRLLIGGACFAVLSGVASFLLITSESGAFGRLLGIAGGVAALVMFVVVMLYASLRRRMLRRVIDMARDLTSGDLSAELDVDGADELAVLSSSLNALRRRLASQMATIERQRRMLQALIDQSQEGVVVARSNGRIALINPAAAKLLSMDVRPGGVGGLIDRHVDDCIPQPSLRQLLTGAPSTPPSAEEAKGAPVGRNGETHSPEVRLEIQSRAGSAFLLARASRLVLAESVEQAGAPTVGRVLLLTDITELERTIQMRTDFVANASHELRTPLSTIRAAVETLLTMDMKAEGPAAVKFLRKIDRQSERLQQMVGDLLDLSRLESTTEHFEPESLDTQPVLDELRARFAEALERKGLHWEVSYDPPGAKTILASPDLLRLVLDNLLDNAIKFADPGGHIRVGLRRKGELAVFEIVDDGCGIPKDEQQRVFERFYQVQQSRSGQERGTGLGLSIVRHAVDAMDGQVRLESNPGGGTRVVVVVPQTKG
jgi:two-component system, OmpR family, phosphate regulon sensor histidine kinase PhoR